LPDFNFFFVAYLRDDSAREPIAVEDSTERLLADASAKLGRPKPDFEIQEINENGMRR
jgi:hypothetical protein